jgi:hypothetical protein
MGGDRGEQRGGRGLMGGAKKLIEVEDAKK